jgi:hypothetical protein
MVAVLRLDTDSDFIICVLQNTAAPLNAALSVDRAASQYSPLSAAPRPGAVPISPTRHWKMFREELKKCFCVSNFK